jgi:hypothetical protein
MRLICPANVWKMIIPVGIGHFLGVTDHTDASRLRVGLFTRTRLSRLPNCDLNLTDSRYRRHQRATSWEDLRALNPTFTVGRGQHKAREFAIKAVKSFREAYRAALDLWRGGDRRAQFPAGT